MLDEQQGLGGEVNREDGAGVGAAGLRDVRAVILGPAERRIDLADDGAAAGEIALLGGRDEFMPGDEVGAEDVEVLRRMLGHPAADRLRDLRAGVGEAKHVAVAFFAAERVGRRIRDHQRHLLRRQVRRHRQCDGRIDDAGHHVDPVGQHELSRLGEADIRLAFAVLVDELDLAPRDLAAGLLDGILHALELALPEHREHAGGLHQDADLQGLGRTRRRHCLDQERHGESADDRMPHDESFPET